MKKKESLVARIFEKIAPTIGAKVLLESEWGMVGQIIYKNGKKSYFRGSSLDINPLGSSEIARDKDFAYYFMKGMGYPTIEGKTFYSDEWATKIKSDQTVDLAYKYAMSLNFPLIVKPNSRSQGNGVTKVNGKEEFDQAIKYAFEKDQIVLVQRYVSGKDYRIVVLGDKVISAYERIPLSVIGDGVSNIKELITIKQNLLKDSGRKVVINLNDFRILYKLKNQGLNMESVLEKNTKVFLLDNANLSAGGDSIDATSDISDGFKKLAISLTKDMGLCLCGVDLIINGSIDDNAEKTEHWILEVNSSPGVDNYYSMGDSQKKIVEDLYLEVLKEMETY
ncbi:MAG: cyanophycin synthetase [bacterium]